MVNCTKMTVIIRFSSEEIIRLEGTDWVGACVELYLFAVRVVDKVEGVFVILPA